MQSTLTIMRLPTHPRPSNILQRSSPYITQPHNAHKLLPYYTMKQVAYLTIRVGSRAISPDASFVSSSFTLPCTFKFDIAPHSQSFVSYLIGPHQVEHTHYIHVVHMSTSICTFRTIMDFLGRGASSPASIPLDVAIAVTSHHPHSRGTQHVAFCNRAN